MRKIGLRTERGFSLVEFFIVILILGVLLVISLSALWPDMPASAEKTTFSSVDSYERLSGFDPNENAGRIIFRDVFIQDQSRGIIKNLEIEPEFLNQITVDIDPNLEGTAISAKFDFFERLDSRNKYYINPWEVTIWVQSQKEKEQWEAWLAKQQDNRNSFLKFKFDKELKFRKGFAPKKFKKILPPS